jgi:diguanylate cyclase (GGDEF)-like protein
MDMPMKSEIEKALARDGLAFPPLLETSYELETRPRRVKRIRVGMVRLAVVYNLFLIPDWILVQDLFPVSIALHLLVVTPWIFLTGWLTTEETSKWRREGLAATLPIVIVLQILVSFVFTKAPDAAHYQYFVLLVVLYTNTIQRLPFRLAVLTSGIIVGLHTIAVGLAGHMSAATSAVAVTTLAASAYLTLTSAYYLELDRRRGFLHVLRDRLLHTDTENASKHDPLTGLANRRYLDQRLQQLWDQAGSTMTIGIAMIDVDWFKLYNDRYGHVAGDTALKRVASCVQSELRGDDDLAVRFGGEEILVLLPAISQADATRFAERLRREIEGLRIPHEALGPTKVVSVSIGFAVGSTASASSGQLIDAADRALYEAKQNGRNAIWPPLLRTQPARATRRKG